MLLVHTQEVSVDFTGFPLSVTVEPDCSCSEDPRMGCSECGTTQLVFHASERDDGAVAQWLNFRARTEDVRRVLTEALESVTPTG